MKLRSYYSLCERWLNSENNGIKKTRVLIFESNEFNSVGLLCALECQQLIIERRELSYPFFHHGERNEQVGKTFGALDKWSYIK